MMKRLFRNNRQAMRIGSILFGICILVLFYADGSARIAFVANIDGNWDLFVSDGNGKNTVQLTQTDYDERDPSWSGDRQNIVYATSDGQLNIIHLGSKETKQIAHTDLKTAKITPSFSPDGRKIAFIQFRPPVQGDDTDLMLYDLETTKIRRLIDQSAIQMWPVWSPDGSRIVYANMHCAGECGRLIQELWIMDPHEKWSRQLLLTHSFCQQPIWSPNGENIAFSSDRSGNFDIWTINLKSWHLQQITLHEGLDIKPAWSQDGKKIAFISMRSGKMEIWIKDLKTNRTTKLNPFGEKNIECKDVAW